MTRSEIRINFQRNLNYFLNLNNLNQNDLAEWLNVTGATVSTWCSGKKMPRADKLEDIASFLGVRLSDLIGDNANKNEPYYFNKETRDIAQSIFEDKDLRLLFDAARDASPEDLQLAHNMLKALKRKERGEDDA